MGPRQWSTALRGYGIAVLAVAAAAGLGPFLTPVLGERAGLVTFFAAVLITAWSGGFGPAITAVLLSVLVATVLPLMAGGSMAGGSAAVGLVDGAGLAAFLVLGGGCALLGRSRPGTPTPAVSTGGAIGPPDPSVPMIDPDDRDRVLETVAAATAEGGSVEVEYRLVNSDEGTQSVIARSEVVGAESNTLVWPPVNVSSAAQRRVEDAIRASEEQIRLALDSAELGAWHVDTATSSLRTDQRFRQIFGVTTDEIDFEQAVAIIDSNDRERVMAAIAAATDPDDPQPYAIEYRVVHADATVRWVFAKGRANFEQVGQTWELTSFDGTVMDVTDQRRISDELREIAARLSEADRRKDEFLATLAHELRNPLAPIRTGLEVLKTTENPADQQEIQAMMVRQIGQMVHLIDDLLDVSRITRGKLDLRLERLELADIVRSAVEATGPVIEAAGHELNVALPDGPVHLRGDATRLTQVFSNLLNNAAKYTRGSGRIDVSVRCDPGEAVITITDSGIGISPDQRDQIFEMFSQIDRSLETGYTGLGIGLTLVKRLVEMHGGTVGVDSDGLGHGSAFHVRLPIDVTASSPAAEPTTVAAPAAEPLPPTPSLRVLVVDDNRAAATMLQMVVQSCGHRGQTAYDGQQAIAAAAEFDPDFIVMDIGMPKMNGYEAARHIRSQPWGERTRLIALTGWGQDEDRQRSREAGFDHHLVKPAEPEELMRIFAEFPAERQPG